METQKIPQEITTLMEMRRWEDALGAIKKLMEIRKDDSQLLLKKAQILFILNLFAECKALCQLSQGGDNVAGHLVLLDAASENWLYKRDTILSEIRKYAPLTLDDIHRDLATILAVFCDIKEATYYLMTVLKSNDNPHLWFLLASIQRASGRLKDALGCLEKARDYPPAVELKEKVRVEILRSAQKTQKVDTYQDTVVVQEAKAGYTGEDWMVRGLTSTAEKNYVEALKSFGEALKADPKLMVCWYYVGRIQRLLGAEEKAAQCFKRFIEGFPQSSGFYRERLEALEGSGDREQVEDIYHRWIGYFPSDHRSWMAYLKYLLESHDLKGAQLVCSEILENYMKRWFLPINTSQFHVLKGLLELCVGRTSAAMESFRTSLRFEGPQSVALLGMGRCSENIGRLIEAQEFYEKASRQDNTKFIGLYQKIGIHIKKKEFRKALTATDEAVKSTGSSSYFLGRKAEILIEAGDYQGFIDFIAQNGIQESLPVHLALQKVMVLWRAARLDDALAELESLERRYPGNYLVLKNLAVIHLKTTRYLQALEAIYHITDKIKRFEPEFFLMEGAALYHLKRYEDAREVLEGYMNLYPFDYRLWIVLALTEYELGNIEGAGLCFKKGREFSGGTYHTSLNHGIFYSIRGEFEKALKCLDTLRDSGRADVLYYLARTCCHRGLNELEEAHKHILMALRIEPQNITALMFYGILEFEKGTREQSLEVFSKVIVLDGSYADAWYCKGFVALHLNNTALAKECIDRAIELNPSFYDAWIGRAVLNWVINNEEEAKKALKGAKNIKAKDFKEWLQYASTQRDPISTIKIYDRIPIPFYIPELFSLSIEEPMHIFNFERLDGLFKKG
ncbi:MAG: tetratricopeptide repeat protein [Candidatus Eremiobacteraeota bacterium]|nr:tetratricopeptide repeat protein [Candidatus Eremiobacteraeota bacterium]